MTRPVDIVLAELDAVLDELGAAEPGMEHAPEVLDRFGLEPVLAIWDDVLQEATR